MADLRLDRVSFIVLRHMRTPFIVLVCVYAVAMVGMVSIPGLPDENGNPTYMSFFHAYYFLAYTATTTGFGELPIAFSNAQRMWAVVCLYVSVVSWLYGIGKIIALIKNPHLQSAIEEVRFIRAVRKKRKDYYLVCGFGDTGSILLRSMTDMGLSAVVLDEDIERIKALSLRDYRIKVLGLCADASIPRFLQYAGVERKECIGVLILSNDEEANLKVTISARLLRPDIKIICRSTIEENEGEILGVGGDTHIVDPFRVFSSYLSMMIYNPVIHTLNEWLSGDLRVHLGQNMGPLKGRWILCGHGRMGKIVYKKLTEKNIDVTVIEPLVGKITEIPGHAILGRANKNNFEKAGIDDCIGIIAGTDSDTFNLSMIHQANKMNPLLFSIARQNQHNNEVLFNKANVDYIMQPSLVISRMVLFTLTAPLLKHFFSYLRKLFENDPPQLAMIINRLDNNVGGQKPLTKSYVLTAKTASAVYQLLEEEKQVTLGDIYKDPTDKKKMLKAVPIAHKRGKVIKIMPKDDLALVQGDEILFCMRKGVEILLESTMSNEYTLHYLMTGQDLPRGLFFCWLNSSGMYKKLIRNS